ncbi:MAG: type II/IV secretion system ATPase subunit [Candidatus Nanoarchaeia archaeon]|nr:type II/IV secretion system ATPase subunit [Candidatus Nanoarchaeia archaeon]
MVSAKERGYEVVKEGQEQALRVNAENWAFSPSIEGNALTMSRTIDFLVEVPNVSRIIFVQRRIYSYDFDQTQMLIEISNLYKRWVRQKNIISLTNVLVYPGVNPFIEGWRQRVQYIILNLIKSDPIGAYVELIRAIREENVRTSRIPLNAIEGQKKFIELLEEMKNMIENTKLINLVKNNLAGYHIGDRMLYSLIFRPAISPDFIFTQLMARIPLDSEQLDVYTVNGAEVNIYRIEKDIKYLYHLTPPEFKLTEDKYELLDLARMVLAEHKPREEEFLDPEKMRITFFNIGRDLLQELSQTKGIEVSYNELIDLANILVRYTVGFGLIEILLSDEKVQDVTINSPIGENPVFLVHQDFDECVTNIIPSREDAEGWASKFRILSGRPLDEANPILDTELILPDSRSRVAIVQKPLNPFGLAYAFRRHRDKPWTLALFIENRMLNPLAAGLISFLIDGARTLLFAGTRSSGKTSLLGSALVEVMRKYRIITVEDTLELPTESLRKLGYNIQPMKVRSALTKGGSEIAADEGIRTTLRMGDSSLIVGEIRSSEAFALYEAMRIGALANVVAGTIHGDSAYGVFDRVVNDLKVPATSFKATDIIIISNPVKSPDGLHKWRRVISITEVRKHWERDPITEKGFVELMKYNPGTDSLEPTADLLNGDSEIIKGIAGNVREWVGNWDLVWDNILLRAKMKETLVRYAKETKDHDLLEAKFTINSNDMFHRISDKVLDEAGKLDSRRIFFEWEEWLKRKVKERKEL